MNNDILIIIHRDKCKDVLEAMYDLINYLPDIRKNMYVDKHRAVIDICNHIRVDENGRLREIPRFILFDFG